VPVSVEVVRSEEAPQEARTEEWVAVVAAVVEEKEVELVVAANTRGAAQW